MRILFDKNIPVGVRGFLPNHEVRTFAETQWPDQLKNGELLAMAEEAGFDVMVISDQNITKPVWPQTRFSRLRIQYLADFTPVRRSDCGQSCWSNTGRV